MVRRAPALILAILTLGIVQAVHVQVGWAADLQHACDPTKSADQAALCQQWRMANASEEMVDLGRKQLWATVGQIGALFATLCFTAYAAISASRAAEASKDAAAATHKGAIATRKAADAAVEANKLNRDVFIAEQRPWLTVDVAIGRPLIWNKEGGATITFLIEVKNIGRTPALNVWSHFEIRLMGGAQENLQRQQLRFAADTRAKPPTIGFTVFPGQTGQQQRTISIGKEKIDEATAEIPILFPIMIGCVDYSSSFGIRHQTGFIYQLLRNGGGIEANRVDIPADDLKLMPWIEPAHID